METFGTLWTAVPERGAAPSPFQCSSSFLKVSIVSRRAENAANEGVFDNEPMKPWPHWLSE